MMHFTMLSESQIFNNRRLYRIQALEDLPIHNVKAGDLGGWIEDRSNLSHRAWVGDEAKVWGNAKIGGSARIFGNATVHDNARVEGNARIFEGADISNFAAVTDAARISGKATVEGNAFISGNACIVGNAVVGGYATISGGAFLQKSSDFICMNGVGLDNDLITVWRGIRDNHGFSVNFSIYEYQHFDDYMRDVFKKETGGGMLEDCYQQEIKSLYEMISHRIERWRIPDCTVSENEFDDLYVVYDGNNAVEIMNIFSQFIQSFPYIVIGIGTEKEHLAQLPNRNPVPIGAEFTKDSLIDGDFFHEPFQLFQQWIT